ncbi:hypothetical protein Q4Q70_16165, partial [Morganella morganii]
DLFFSGEERPETLLYTGTEEREEITEEREEIKPEQSYSLAMFMKVRVRYLIGGESLYLHRVP